VSNGPTSGKKYMRQLHPGLPPTGFIFHMSRCGSTLVSQMLASIPDNVVISEAGPIDAVVQAQATLPDLDHDRHAEWLRGVIGALGQPRTGGERPELSFSSDSATKQALTTDRFQSAAAQLDGLYGRLEALRLAT
jgi:hypothetical protein